jgi:hypothetical protein
MRELRIQSCKAISTGRTWQEKTGRAQRLGPNYFGMPRVFFPAAECREIAATDSFEAIRKRAILPV